MELLQKESDANFWHRIVRHGDTTAELSDNDLDLLRVLYGCPSYRPTMQELAAGDTDHAKAGRIVKYNDLLRARRSALAEPAANSDGERTTDKKTDSGKKLPPHDVNNCARYVVEQRKLIRQGKRLDATKKALIAEHLGNNRTARMEKELQPCRYGWLLDIGGQADK